MQTVDHTYLISAAPLEDLVLLAILFTLAALILLALSVEAGNYPNLSAMLRRLQRTLQRARDAARHVHEGYRRPGSGIVETPASGQ